MAAAGHQDPQEMALLCARLHTRQLCLSHLSRASPLPPDDEGYPPYPSTDARSIAYSVDLVLWKIRNHTRRQDLVSASNELFTYSSPALISTLGKVQAAKLELARGVILRFQGRFTEAYEVFIHFPATNTRVLSHLSAVMCEMGQCDRAIAKLEAWLQLSTRPCSKASRRIKLALANAWLLKTLSMTSHLQGDPAMYSVGLEIAHRLYGELQESEDSDWLERVLTGIGCAVLKHIGLQIEPAINAWHHVRNLSRECGLCVGYTDMVSVYSLSDLEFRRGGLAESDIYVRQARDIFVHTGKQYHFSGLGTIWLNILQQWLSVNGRASHAIA